MKYLFMCIFALLGLASIATWKMLPASKYDVPVVYWVTDPNPARIEQIAIFQRWLKKDPSRPAMHILLDAANSRTEKKIIQGVSGVGGDTMDIGGGGGMRYFNAIGLLEPVTEFAKKYNYDLSTTYEAIRPELAQDGEQYIYPCNVYATAYWVDNAQFDELGMKHPPLRWDFDTFERIGKEYVTKANKGSDRQTRFLASSVDTELLHRSMGLARFNETLTRCQLDDERYIKALELKYKWTYKDHIVPTAAEASGFDVESGYGGPAVYLFSQGNYAMFNMGRYALIRLRELQQERLDSGKPLMKLGILEPPHGGFPITRTGTRALGVYSGGKNKELAVIFQSYLASKDYNMQVVRDADALPPNPKYTKTAAFEKPLPLLPPTTLLKTLFAYSPDEYSMLSDFRIDFYEALDQVDRDKPWSITDLPRPPQAAAMSDAAYQEKLAQFDQQYNASLPTYKSEWGLHERFLFLMDNIALPADITPFAVPDTISMEIRNAEAKYFNERATVEEASQRAATRINAAIQRTLSENPA
ncbi:MAG: carbohydrate ABC transporter substrate-binding protein [Phycisphaeraceae bacterium]|nr:carbohydrate ABC transporter substrate-binding protein [Phycisphaeraceae bacterium]